MSAFLQVVNEALVSPETLECWPWLFLDIYVDLILAMEGEKE